MSFETILDDLRRQFGAKRAVLHPQDLADLLGSGSPIVKKMGQSVQLRIPVKKVGGKVCVSIHDVADWLASDLPSKRASNSGSGAAIGSVGYPQNRRASLGRTLLGLQRQHEFLGELIACIKELESLSNLMPIKTRT